MRTHSRLFVGLALASAAVLGGITNSALSVCGPFTDVAADAFCPFVLEVFYTGITTGTTATTYDPAGNVSRLQMAAFLSRTVDTTLKRASRRTAQRQLWTAQNTSVLGVITTGSGPLFAQFDGADVWVSHNLGNTVSRVRGSDAKLLETWTGATNAYSILIAMNRVIVTGETTPGKLYVIDPSQPAGAVTTVASNLGGSTRQIAFDGARAWTANFNGSVSIITPGASIPWTVTTVTVAAGSTHPEGALYDGSSIWVTDRGLNKLYKLDGSGGVLLTVTVGGSPFYPAFDGTNIWVPNEASNSVTIVRASSGTVLETLTGNGLNLPGDADFDGERVLVANGTSVSLWKAADLTPLGTFPMGSPSGPKGACNDGTRFWIPLAEANKLVRF